MFMAIKVGMKMDDYKNAQEKIEDESNKHYVNQKINCLQGLIEKAFKNIDDLHHEQLDAKQSHHLELTQVMNDCMDGLKDFRDAIDGFQAKINSMERSLAEMNRGLEQFALSHNLQESVSGIHQRVDNLSSKNNASLDDLRAEMGRHYSNCLTVIQKHKEDVLSIPSEIPELKNLFDKKLELVELNGQNSILRSTNNERHIHLLEKKIENLYQLLKKFDLENQG